MFECLNGGLEGLEWQKGTLLYKFYCICLTVACGTW